MKRSVDCESSLKSLARWPLVVHASATSYKKKPEIRNRIQEILEHKTLNLEINIANLTKIYFSTFIEATAAKQLLEGSRRAILRQRSHMGPKSHLCSVRGKTKVTLGRLTALRSSGISRQADSGQWCRYFAV